MTIFALHPVLAHFAAFLFARERGRRGALREWLARQGDGCFGGAVIWSLRSCFAAAEGALR
jgi:hypothetical protein